MPARLGEVFRFGTAMVVSGSRKATVFLVARRDVVLKSARL
jgi:hypothetical protein